MQVKLKQLVEAQAALNELSSKQLIAKTAFRIGRTLKIIGGELEIYEQQRTVLAKRLGTLTADKTVYHFENGNGEKFESEHKALLDTTVENAIGMIPLAELSDVKMSPGAMAALDWLIEDEKKPDAP